MIKDLFKKLTRDYKKLDALRKELNNEPTSFEKDLLGAFIDIIQRNAFNFVSIGMYDYRYEIGDEVYYLENLKLRKFIIREVGLNVYTKDYQMIVDKFYFDIHNNKRYEKELISKEELSSIKELVENKYPQETLDFFKEIL